MLFAIMYLRNTNLVVNGDEELFFVYMNIPVFI